MQYENIEKIVNKLMGFNAIFVILDWFDVLTLSGIFLVISYIISFAYLLVRFVIPYYFKKKFQKYN